MRIIAKDPAYAIEDQFGIEIDWRPLTLDIPSYLGSARLDAQGKVAESNRTPQQWSGVKYAYRDARRYASLRNITLSGTTKIWDSSLAGIGMEWARRRAERSCDATSIVFTSRSGNANSISKIRASSSRCSPQAAPILTGFADYRNGDGRARHDATTTADL